MRGCFAGNIFKQTIRTNFKKQYTDSDLNDTVI